MKRSQYFVNTSLIYPKFVVTDKLISNEPVITSYILLSNFIYIFSMEAKNLILLYIYIERNLILLLYKGKIYKTNCKEATCYLLNRIEREIVMQPSRAYLH